MGMTDRRFAVFTLCLLAGLAAACGKGPAEEALKAATAAIEAARPQLETYVPAEFKQLSDGAAAAKAQFDKGDYKAALQAAQDLLPKTKAALAAAEQKKQELVTAFDHIKGSLPAMVDALTARANALAAMRRLPNGVDKAALQNAQAALGTLANGWAEATASFDKGEVIQAVNKATQLQSQVLDLTQALTPAAATPAKQP